MTALFSVLPRVSVTRVITAGKWLLCVLLTLGSVYVIRLSIMVFLLSRGLYLRNVDADQAANARGDVVLAETDFSGGETHPWKTVIWLKRSGHLFSTTLVEANSFDVSVGMKWRDDDHLVLRLDFGCDGNHTAPVDAVGRIHIAYQFGDPGYTPNRGYELFRRRDLPPEPCD